MLRLSRRRSIRRLRWASCRRILVFTRNPLLAEVCESVVTHQTPRKDQGISSFSVFDQVKGTKPSLVRGLVLRHPWSDGWCRSADTFQRFTTHTRFETHETHETNEI